MEGVCSLRNIFIALGDEDSLCCQALSRPSRPGTCAVLTSASHVAEITGVCRHTRPNMTFKIFLISCEYLLYSKHQRTLNEGVKFLSVSKGGSC